MFQPIGAIALLLTIVFIFIFQANAILKNPLNVLLIAIPLTIQTLLVFTLAYGAMYAAKVEYEVAAPGALIASSNFFELAVALFISLFGLESGATLDTV